MTAFDGRHASLGDAVVADPPIAGYAGTKGRSIVGRLVQPLVLSALNHWSTGRLTAHLPDGRTREWGPAGATPHATVWVEHERFFKEFVFRSDLGAGESYMNGDWRVDDLPTFLELIVRNQGVLTGDTWLTRLLNVPSDVVHRLRRNTRGGSRRNIRAHYDLSNDLFGLFLDQSMVYSSAMFAHPDERLEEAQLRKLRAMADRVGLRAGDHVLEIGCGWGAFAMLAAREYGCRVTGVTISAEQLELARARVAAAGLADRIEIRLCDYRDLQGRFDHIVSIEMLEAVGRAHWPDYFRACERVLAPGGRLALQVIAMPDPRFERYARHCDWIQKYIFPGGLLPSAGELCRAAAVPSLTIRHLEDIGPHYGPTLARWRRMFLDRIDDVRRLGFDERFIRMWDFYLGSCEAWFRTRAIGNLQVVFARIGE